MRSEAIARNYADTLLALAQRHGGLGTAEEFLRAIEDVAALVEREPRVRAFLDTPRVGAEAKKQALRASLAGRVPELFLRFVLVVVEKRRQGLLRDKTGTAEAATPVWVKRDKFTQRLHQIVDRHRGGQEGRIVAALLGNTE